MLTPLELWKSLCLSKQRNKACRTKVSIESHNSSQLYFKITWTENSHFNFPVVKDCFQIDHTFWHSHLILIFYLLYLYLKRMCKKMNLSFQLFCIDNAGIQLPPKPLTANCGEKVAFKETHCLKSVDRQCCWEDF